MVFFLCPNCGEALKKNKVEKHCNTKCRSAHYVSCVDCSVDFWGNDYEKHTKCISEEQKYNGKDFVPKRSVGKAEKKQDAFKQQIETALSKGKLEPNVELLLNKLLECDNVPNKKKKFENFMKNCFRNYNSNVIGEVWRVCDAEKVIIEVKKQVKNEEEKSDKEDTPSPPTSYSECEPKEEEVKLNKKQRKEAKKKAKLAKELEVIEGEKLLKKKFQEIEISNRQNTNEENSEKSTKKDEKKIENDSKKRRRIISESENISPDKKLKNTSDNDEKEDEIKKTKFNWDKIIIKILEDSDDHEMKLKKLQKKVLSEYTKEEYIKVPLSDSDLIAKFSHKVTHNAKFKCQKNTVKLLKK